MAGGARAGTIGMTRARVTLTVDEAARIVFIRYIGDVDGHTVTETSIGQFSDIGRCGNMMPSSTCAASMG